MRSIAAGSAILSVGACDPSPCSKPLDEWCFHDEAAGGPVVPEDAEGATCAPPALDHPQTCGRYVATCGVIWCTSPVFRSIRMRLILSRFVPVTRTKRDLSG